MWLFPVLLRIYRTHSGYVSLFIYLFVCVHVYMCLFVYVSVYIWFLSMCMCLCLCVSMCISVYFYMCPCDYVSMRLRVSLSLCIGVHLSIYLFVNVSMLLCFYNTCSPGALIRHLLQLHQLTKNSKIKCLSTWREGPVVEYHAGHTRVDLKDT